MTRLIIAFSLLAILFSAAARADDASIIAPGAKLEKLAGGFVFTEGPSVDAKGNVYFTDQPNDRIMIWSIDGKLTTFTATLRPVERPVLRRGWRLWACADEKNELWRIDVTTGKHEVVVKDYHGKLLNGPNDVWVRPDGGLYFTDPFYKRPYWKRGPTEQDNEATYYLSPDRKSLTRVTGDLSQPNGIIGTPDGKTLYVSDIRAGQTFAYDIQADGTLANKRLFCKLGSDGMTIDDQGNVYLTGKGVTVFDKSGKQIEHIDVPEDWTGNVCFGGRDMQTLFITASKGIYALKMTVKVLRGNEGFKTTPKGFRPPAQGCPPQAGYPGWPRKNIHFNPNGAAVALRCRNPVGVERALSSVRTQRSPPAADNVGLEDAAPLGHEIRRRSSGRYFFTGTSLFRASRFPNGSRKNASQTSNPFQPRAMTWASVSTFTPADFSSSTFRSINPASPGTRK